ncbi:MAG: NADAR family protein [Thermonemataceae bacterium]
MKYTLAQTIAQFEAGEKLKYVFFWGHTVEEGNITKTSFSQWYPAPFTVEQVTYKTTEHWMMARKAALFNDADIEAQILQVDQPGKAKAIGRKVKAFEPTVWDAHKYEIVVKGNFHKFSQNPPLKTFLLNTQSRILVEASPVDRIWGIGMAQDHQDIEVPSRWKGQNLLGFALMEVRDLLA